jgi:hypothetical protein
MPCHAPGFLRKFSRSFPNDALLEERAAAPVQRNRIFRLLGMLCGHAIWPFYASCIAFDQVSYFATAQFCFMMSM